MTTVATMYNIQPVIESACVHILSSSLGITEVFTSRTSGSRDEFPYVRVGYNGQSPTGIMHLTGSQYFDAMWNANLTVQVVTERVNSESNHMTYVSNVLATLSRNDLFNTASLLPNHYVVYNKPTSYSTTSDEGGFFDGTSIQFNMRICANPNNW